VDRRGHPVLIERADRVPRIALGPAQARAAGEADVGVENARDTNRLCWRPGQCSVPAPIDGVPQDILF
jgi:hypothetical protein